MNKGRPRPRARGTTTFTTMSTSRSTFDVDVDVEVHVLADVDGLWDARRICETGANGSESQISGESATGRAGVPPA